MLTPAFLHRLSSFGRIAGPFPVPDKTKSAVGRRRRRGRPPGRRGTRLALDVGEPRRTLSITGSWTGKPRASRATVAVFLALIATCGATVCPPAHAAIAVQAASEIDQAIAEASARFGLSPSLIRAVLRAESGGQVDAVSSKGAMGLMQLMPATWSDMRDELGLGNDPFLPRDNILAGARYLRVLYDRFGSPDFLAAYNAGPSRYQRHLDGAAPLPSETLVYVRDVRRRAAIEASPLVSQANDWRTSGLFIERTADEVGHSVFVPANEDGRQ